MMVLEMHTATLITWQVVSTVAGATRLTVSHTPADTKRNMIK
jgi:hypothetical protein